MPVWGLSTCWRNILLLGLMAWLLWSASSVPAEPAATSRTRSAPVRDRERTFRQEVKSWTSLRKENVVMQQRDFSCGAAALATLIRYHWGQKLTETQLLEEAVNMLTAEEMKDRIKNGLSLTDLRRMSVRVGYQAAIGRQEFDKMAEVKIPLIVGIVVNGFNHFVVYRGTDGQYVYLADPARGNVRTPIPEFKQQWQKNAVLVVIKPGVNPERDSVLNVGPWEKQLGETNRVYVQRQMTSALPPR